MPALAPPSLGRRIALQLVDVCIPVSCLALFIAISGETYELLHLQTGLVLALLVLVIFNMNCVYDCLSRSDLWRWCQRVATAWIITACAFMAVLFVAKVEGPTSGLLITTWAATTLAMLLLSRGVLYAIMLDRHRRGISKHNVLMIGDPQRCLALAEHFDDQDTLGFKIIGLVSSAAHHDAEDERFPLMGSIDDLAELVETYHIQRVIIAASITDSNLLEEVVDRLHMHPVIMQLAPDLSRLPTFGFDSIDYHGQPVINLRTQPLSDNGVIAKWLIDKLVGSLALLLISPVMLAIAIAIKLTSPGPVFFIQDRHGLYGRTIRVYKFRTMTHNSDRLAAAGSETTTSGRFRQASANDSRITPIGHFLRKTSLDELPQLLNVLGGSMSLIGPRPHPIKLNSQFAHNIRELMGRHYVKPGITGLAQVSGARGETRTVEEMEKRVQLDLEYIQNWSVWMDLRILLLTPWRGIFNRQP